MLCKAVVGILLSYFIMSRGFTNGISYISTALHNHSSSGSLIPKQARQITMNNILIFTMIYFIIIHAQI